MADLRRIRAQISKEIDRAKKAGWLQRYFAQMELDVRSRWGEAAFNGRSNGKKRTAKS